MCAPRGERSRVLEEAWAKRLALAVGAALLVAIGTLLVSRGYTARRARERRARGRLRRFARDTLDGLSEPIAPRRLAMLVVFSVVAWILWAVAAMLVARSVGIELGLLDAVFVAAVINLGVAIPSSPGFVGTYQWLSVAALGVFDVAREDALSFAILVQAVWYIPTTAVGAVLLGRSLVVRLRRQER